MPAGSCIVVRVDATARPNVAEGDVVQAGQAIGKACCRSGFEVAPMPGKVCLIEYEPQTRRWLVFIAVGAVRPRLRSWSWSRSEDGYGTSLSATGGITTV
jgi:hypothetical protein